MRTGASFNALYNIGLFRFSNLRLDGVVITKGCFVEAVSISAFSFD